MLIEGEGVVGRVPPIWEVCVCAYRGRGSSGCRVPPIWEVCVCL